MKKGRFIVFEGIDGSGKATQLRLLVNFLKKKEYQIKNLDFPQYYTTLSGKLAGRFLKGEFGKIGEVNPYLACLPYAADRFEAKERIKKWLSQGKMIISNRYTGSNMGHQTVKLPKKEQPGFLRFLEKMEYEILGIPKEDIDIFFYMPVEISQRLVDKKGNRGYVGGKKRDVHENDLKHLKDASKMYLRLVKRYTHWVKIDCCNKKGNLKAPEEIHEKVLKVLKRKRIIRK